MTTVLIQYGEPGADGKCARQAHFRLRQGKLHLPTIRKYFNLLDITLDGVTHTADSKGFTTATFEPEAVIRVDGRPSRSLVAQTKITLVKFKQVYADTDQAYKKRRVIETEEEVGIWALPPPESAPRTLSEMKAAIAPLLRDELCAVITLAYFDGPELLWIRTDAGLTIAFEYFRRAHARFAGDEARQRQHCRLQLHLSGWVPPKAEIPEAVALLTKHLVASGHAPPRHAAPQQVAADDAPQNGAGAAAAAAAARQEAVAVGNGAGGSAAARGQAEPARGRGRPPRASASADASPENDELLDVRTARARRERLPDGRYRDHVEHISRLEDMKLTVEALFDGKIVGLAEVLDFRTTLCRLCHSTVLVAPYGASKLRNHFLAVHEQLLEERGVDLNRTGRRPLDK